MHTTICISASTFYYPNGGGHMWVYLNWALGFKAIGCDVIWLEGIHCELGIENFNLHLSSLKSKLEFYGLSENIAIWVKSGDPTIIPSGLEFMAVELAASRSDLLLNQFHNMPSQVLDKFKKTALLDIDPGLSQIWISNGSIKLAPHDIYFSIGETVGKKSARFTNAGIDWNYIPPCVFLPEWPVATSADSSPYTTVSHWATREWEENNGEYYHNDKRTGFLPFLEIPLQINRSFELAVFLGPDEQNEKKMLENLKWKVRNSQIVTSTPQKYRQYIQSSRGEFSCVKPSCLVLQNAWISDRSLCYLSSGKPVIVQHTGPSDFLPNAAGLFRFRDFNDAVRCIEECEKNYEKHCLHARLLAEEYFDAKKVTKTLLEKCL